MIYCIPCKLTDEILKQSPEYKREYFIASHESEWIIKERLKERSILEKILGCVALTESRAKKLANYQALQDIEKESILKHE
jgi:hypothetical protein